MGRRQRYNRNQRSVHGVVLLDKPVGITSNDALQQVKRLFRARKAGHTGSLDPLASGLLPVCLGEATKVSGFLLDADKRYWVRCRLGQRTTTGDAEGEIQSERSFEGIGREQLLPVLEQFLGEIDQIPPMYSAVKHQGQRLYKLARQGVVVEREPRRVTIHALDLLDVSAPFVDIAVRCSKGTYVRTLVEDMGEVLGCGAHVADLRRDGVGPYTEENMISLERLQALGAEGEAHLDNVVLSVESALADWPEVSLTGDAAFYLRQGQPVVVPHAPTSGWVRLYEGKANFLGMGQILDDGRVAPRRLLRLA